MAEMDGNGCRHYYLKEANIFVPEPGHQKSILAVSALARAMEASNQIALVRCVWRQGQNNVVLGVLTPYLATEDNVVSPGMNLLLFLFHRSKGRISAN